MNFYHYFKQTLQHLNAPTFNRNSNQPPQRNNGNIPQKQESAIPIGLRPFSPDQRPRVCRRHLYFGENSRTCKPWCRWPNKRSCTVFKIIVASTPYEESGKLSERVAIAPTGPPLFKVAARIGSINVDFVVDTGTSISILTLHLSGSLLLNPTAVRLSSADGSGIACHGEAHVELLVPTLRHSFRWTFVVANTVNALLGADFILHFGLIVDDKNFRLVDSATKCYCTAKALEN